MKLVTFVQGNQYRSGISTDQGIVDVSAAGQALGVDVPSSVADLAQTGFGPLRKIVDSIKGGESWLLDLAGVKSGPVVTDPGKIICIGLNYARHAAESNLPIPESPVVFSKFNNTLAGHGEDIPLIDGVASQFDYEVELCAVIGKRAKNVSEADALGHVLGYCTANDLSVRDLQSRTTQWLLGKTPDKFFPIGPYLVTADEVGDPQALRLTCKVNGETRQDSNTADMIFTVAELISYCSQYFTLEPGDLITTGTPEGVAMGRADKPWLKKGDLVEVEVEKLGILTNTMV